MLKLMDKLLSLGGFLDGKKTLIGVVVKVVAQVGIAFPQVPAAQILASLDALGEALFALGVIHWKIKDLARE